MNLTLPALVSVSLVNAGLAFQYSPYHQQAIYELLGPDRRKFESYRESVWFIPFEDGHELRIWFEDEFHLILGVGITGPGPGDDGEVATACCETENNCNFEDGIIVSYDPPLVWKRLTLDRLDDIHNEIYSLIETCIQISKSNL